MADETEGCVWISYAELGYPGFEVAVRVLKNGSRHCTCVFRFSGPNAENALYEHCDSIEHMEQTIARRAKHMSDTGREFVDGEWKQVRPAPEAPERTLIHEREDILQMLLTLPESVFAETAFARNGGTKEDIRNKISLPEAA